MRYERNKKPPPRLVSVTPRSWIRKLVPHVGASGPESPLGARLTHLQFCVQGRNVVRRRSGNRSPSLNGKVINHGEVADALSASIRRRDKVV
jgi:hypothetical protein